MRSVCVPSSYAEGVPHLSPGLRSYPGIGTHRPPYPSGVVCGTRLEWTGHNPFGVDGRHRTPAPGVAAQPRAIRQNRFAVGERKPPSSLVHARSGSLHVSAAPKQGARAGRIASTASPSLGRSGKDHLGASCHDTSRHPRCLGSPFGITEHRPSATAGTRLRISRRAPFLLRFLLTIRPGSSDNPRRHGLPGGLPAWYTAPYRRGRRACPNFPARRRSADPFNSLLSSLLPAAVCPTTATPLPGAGRMEALTFRQASARRRRRVAFPYERGHIGCQRF